MYKERFWSYNVEMNFLLSVSAVPVNMTLTKADCDDLTYVCILLTNDFTSTYTEVNITDNVACYDVVSSKICVPGNGTCYPLLYEVIS